MDELLGHVDENRRAFLKKLAGAAFAAPLLASFSMEGIPMAEAVATLCANQTFVLKGGCCELALCIVGEIEDLLIQTTNVVGGGTFTSLTSLPGPAARKQSLIKSLEKALEFMEDGIQEGAGDCTSAAARSKFTYAHGWLINYQETLADLPTSKSGSSLNLQAETIIDHIDALLNCPPLPPP